MEKSQGSSRFFQASFRMGQEILMNLPFQRFQLGLNRCAEPDFIHFHIPPMVHQRASSPVFPANGRRALKPRLGDRRLILAPVPEGHPTIARRFNAGFCHFNSASPAGDGWFNFAALLSVPGSAVPAGLGRRATGSRRFNAGLLSLCPSGTGPRKVWSPAGMHRFHLILK